MNGPTQRLRRSLVLALAVTVGILAVEARGDVVERRGAEPALEGKITYDEAGVTIRTDSGADYHIPWDRVRRIESDDPAIAPDRFMDTAVDLWRARSRVERGDTPLAEPLLERLFERYRGRTDATARVVAEGLLRCRLARGANALAIIPALETARLERAGITTDSYAGLANIIDVDTALCPQLGPAWMHSRALARIERDLETYKAKGDPVVAAIGRLYLRAVRQHLGKTPPSDDDQTASDAAIISEHRGAGFIAILIDCGSSDAGVRDSARTRAGKEILTAPRWAAAWARFAIGSSLLREAGIGRQQRGMVQLLHLPAEHRRDVPYLAGLALSLVAEASRQDGDTTTARVLTEELTRSFPSHPVRFVRTPVSLPPA